MKEKIRRKDVDSFDDDYLEEDNPQGYPSYPSTEDIYGKFKKAKEINPDDSSPEKRPVKSGVFNEKDFDDDFSGDDLDVPGSDLDDDMELTGDEDEENNYYSLGGENHDDLEEDYGE